MAYQGQLSAKNGSSVIVNMQKVLRMLLQEFKSDKQNTDMSIQTVCDNTAMKQKCQVHMTM